MVLVVLNVLVEGLKIIKASLALLELDNVDGGVLINNG